MTPSDAQLAEIEAWLGTREYAPGSIFRVAVDLLAALRDAHAENERLREQRDAMIWAAEKLQNERDELRARIEALHPIHVEKSGARVCATCLLVEPCPTRAVLFPAEEAPSE